MRSFESKLNGKLKQRDKKNNDDNNKTNAIIMIMMKKPYNFQKQFDGMTSNAKILK
jgi:hypothetical protein